MPNGKKRMQKSCRKTCETHQDARARKPAEERKIDSEGKRAEDVSFHDNSWIRRSLLVDLCDKVLKHNCYWKEARVNE